MIAVAVSLNPLFETLRERVTQLVGHPTREERAGKASAQAEAANRCAALVMN